MNREAIDWEAKEREMEEEQREAKKLYMRDYMRDYMRKKRENTTAYKRGSYVSKYDREKLENNA